MITQTFYLAIDTFLPTEVQVNEITALNQCLSLTFFNEWNVYLAKFCFLSTQCLSPSAAELKITLYGSSHSNH
jgi:hypothetical protein